MGRSLELLDEVGDDYGKLVMSMVLRLAVIVAVVGLMRLSCKAAVVNGLTHLAITKLDVRFFGKFKFVLTMNVMVRF